MRRNRDVNSWRYGIGSVILLEVLLIASPDWRHVPWFSCDPVTDRQSEDKNATSFSASGTTLKRPLMSAEGAAFPEIAYDVGFQSLLQTRFRTIAERFLRASCVRQAVQAKRRDD